jgi:hypothetical protein
LKNELRIENDTWFAAVLIYLGYPLLKVEAGVGNEYVTVRCPPEDARTIREEYDSEQGLALSNAKTFVKTFSSLTAKVRDTRHAFGVTPHQHMQTTIRCDPVGSLIRVAVHDYVEKCKAGDQGWEMRP